MLGEGLKPGCALSYKTGPVVSQHAAVQWCASLVFPACLRHLSRVSSHSGPIEPPVSEPPQFFGCLPVCKVPDLCSIFQLGADYGFVDYLSKLRAFGFKIPSHEPKRLVCIVAYSGDMGFPGKVTCNIHTQVPGGVYILKILTM